jgi:hypothetical protein
MGILALEALPIAIRLRYGMSTIAYLHTSQVLIPLFTELSRRILPDTEQFHMVDESLIKNTIRDGELSKTATRRVIDMARSAHEGGADVVVVTCSSIGPAVTLAGQFRQTRHGGRCISVGSSRRQSPRTVASLGR